MADRFEVLEYFPSTGLAWRYRARVSDSALASEYGTDQVLLEVPFPDKSDQWLGSNRTCMHQRLKDKIQSPNIVGHFGFERYAFQLCTVTEYVKGGSLRKRLGPSGYGARVPLRECVEIATGIIRGLSAVHGMNILHRSLTPENIFIDECTAKIGCFDLSTVVAPLLGMIATGAVGSMSHMAPEVLGGRGSSYPSDIWSAGVTLYELFTGQLPFPSTNQHLDLKTIVDSIRQDDPPRVCTRRDGLSTGLSDVIACALRKKPSERFGSAEEMYEAWCRIQPETKS